MTANPIGNTKLKAFHPTEFRPLWKAAKTKYKDALAAKKVTFGEDLGKLLDKRAKQWVLMSGGRAKTYKRSKFTPAEQNETNPAKRAATIKLLRANDASNVKFTAGDYKEMVNICNLIIKAARSYKSKIQAMGNPAEAELTEILTNIEESAEKEIITTSQAQAALKVLLAKPNRLDHLK